MPPPANRNSHRSTSVRCSMGSPPPMVVVNPEGQSAGIHSSSNVTWNEIPLVAGKSQRVQQVQHAISHSGKPTALRKFTGEGEKYTLCDSGSDPVPPMLLKSHP